IVTVRATRRRAKEWRRVDMADSQARKIRHELACLPEGKMCVELETVGRRGNETHTKQESPRVGFAIVSAFFRSDPLYRKLYHLVRVLEAQLLFNVGAMSLNGLDAQVQRVRNFARALVAAEQLQHFELAIGE